MIYSNCISMALVLSLVACTPSYPALHHSTRVRTPPGVTPDEVISVVKSELAVAALYNHEDLSSTQKLVKAWSGATLLSVQVPQGQSQNNIDRTGNLTVTCTTCYFKGIVKVGLEVDDNFNVTEAVNATVSSIGSNVRNLTDSVGDYLTNYTTGVLSNVQDGVDASDFALPTFPFAFDLTVPEIPETHIKIQFDELELYLELNTVISYGVTYEINLFSSTSPYGVRVGDILQLGIIAAVDLIMSIESTDKVDISTGFHIKLEDGIMFDLALFSDKVSGMVFNGGQFEFLPVTVETAGVSIAAALRIGIHCGIEVAPTGAPGKLPGGPEVRAGIEVALVAHVAESITNITYAPDDKDCKLKVEQEYNFALGAIAGASVGLKVSLLGVPMQTLGPVITTSTAIFTSTLPPGCAISASPKVSPSQITLAANKRGDLSTKILTSKITTSGVSCQLSGVINCPVSMQKTIKTTYTKYHTTAVPSGADPTFPASTFDSIESLKPFGTRVGTMQVLSGSPTRFTASAEATNADPTHAKDAGTKSNGNGKEIGIGVGVGLGVPLIAAIACAFVFGWRRRNKVAQNVGTTWEGSG
ncbi:hypothetical protein HBH42_221880 [Parastagonospora nodorum]|nr:hypothetical protein HBH42_221880 [Parastagonospora nodorum]